MILNAQNWQKIRIELKKNVEPAFKKANVVLPLPFEQIVDIFHSVLDKGEINENINGREDVELLLSMVYVDGNVKLAGSTLDVLSGKLEGYLKKIFKMTGQNLLPPGDGMLAHHLKTIFRVFKSNGHSDFSGFSENYITEFFDKSKPNYNNPDFFKSAHNLGNHFKRFYTCRNEEGHFFRDAGIVEILANIESILVTYLYFTSLYADVLKQKTIHQTDTTLVSSWNILKQYCGNFVKNQTYFLITDKFDLTIEQLSSFANIKWNFIFDMDVNSDTNGLYKAISTNNLPFNINQITHTSDDRGKINAIFPDNTLFWYYVQGVSSSQKSLLSTQRIADWRSMYGRYTQDLMRDYYAKKYSLLLTPIKVIILSKDVDKIREIIYAIKGMDSNLPSIDFIFANDDNSCLIDLKNEISGKEISLSMASFLEGLREMQDVMYPSSPTSKIYLPCHSSKGKNIEIPDTTVTSVKQYFQVIHLNILSEKKDQPETKSFYQGRTINWQELDNHLDVDRTITSDIVKEIRYALEKRVESDIIYLTHYAGAGGSTVARRVAYTIHEDFPVLFLNEIVSSYGETQLVEKLLQIYQLTEIPCLVVVDNSNITRQQVEVLEKVVANRLAKTVFLLVESTFSDPVQSRKKFYIPAVLDRQETNRFITKFTQEYKDRESDFLSIPEESPNVCNPFYFGLIANEEEYVTIDQYVKKRLDGLTKKEKDLLILLSFCQMFAKGKMREVPHFVISTFLNIDEEYILLSKHTDNQKIYDLIIETDDLSWRTIHPLIAEHILKLLLGINDLGVLNPYALKEFSIKLVKSLRSVSENRNEQVLEFLHNIFILRELEGENTDTEEINSDFSDNLYNKKLFSRLINSLDNNNNRLEVFSVLTDEFSDENAHFWGHFSRLYSIDKNFEKSIEVINRALLIDDDFIFHHIKGMCYRTELYRLKDKCWNNKEEAVKYSVQMREYFNKASESFQLARELAPNKEHGYIAFIQMVIQMIEFEYSVSNLKNQSYDYTQFIVSNTWCRNILQQANEVIDEYKDNNQEFENSKIIEKQNLLLRFFGVKDKMINAWQSLLGKENYDQNLVRRQLIYAYLAKNEFDWEKAKGKDIKRILELCEENLENKVEIKDLKLWFDVARRLNTNVGELIKKAQELEFKKQTIETAYMLMSLFAVQAISGVKSGLDNYEKYQKEISKRNTNLIYSKIFCAEWVGIENNSPILLNHRQIGEWSRDNSFFKNLPNTLMRLEGKVVKYINRAQGYIEMSNCGIQVLYQPASCNHFSDDAQKQTKVTFYVGFNYDGARAFMVSNI